MSPNRFNSHLRLAGRDEVAGAGAGAASDRPSWRDREQARLAVVKENRLAAHAPALDPDDPRWMLALQTQARLQGPTLTPERREQLMQSATRLGLRRFEANLVIAVVQDRARMGKTANTAMPADAAPTLRLMNNLDAATGAPRPATAGSRPCARPACAVLVLEPRAESQRAVVRPLVWPRWFLAFATAAALAALILRWLGAL